MSLYEFFCKKKPIYVISHERSGTHLAINLLYRNLYLRQSFLDFPEWKEDRSPDREIYWKSFRKRAADGALPGIIKCHCDVEVFERCLPCWPVVYVIRDPRDTLLSFFHYLNRDEFHEANPGLGSLRCETFGEFLRRPLDSHLRRNFSLADPGDTVVDRWAKHASSWLGKPGVTVVKYETLNSRFRKEMWRVAFGAPAIPKMRMVPYRFGEGGAILPRKGIVGDWKNVFSLEDENLVATTLDRHGLSIAAWGS